MHLSFHLAIIRHSHSVHEPPLNLATQHFQERVYFHFVFIREEYEKFFALWKDADPDIPVLKQARQEYAKLK